jgi:hypothetical protein
VAVDDPGQPALTAKRLEMAPVVTARLQFEADGGGCSQSVISFGSN